MSANDAIDLTVSSPTPAEVEVESSKTKPSKKKASVLPTFLPPCRVCNAKASGYHYGM